MNTLEENWGYKEDLVKEKLLKKRLQTLSVEKNFQMDSILESAIHNLNNVSVEELDQSRTLVDEDIQTIPRSVYLNSSFDTRNLGKLRDKIRRNQYEHLVFNPFFVTKDGKRYYKTILNDHPVLKSGYSKETDNSYVSNTKINHHRYVPLDLEDQAEVLELLKPQHVKYKNYNFSEVARQMRLKKEANDRARLEEKKRKEALKREQRKRGSLMEKIEDVPARNIKKVFENFEDRLSY